MRTDEILAPYRITVLDVIVVKGSDSEYQGIATVRTKKGTERQVPVQITYDGENALWQTKPGTFDFAILE